MINGEFIEADKYVELTIFLNGVELLPSETILIVDEFVGEIEVEGKKIKLPNLIIGSGTMDKYGIILDPREGIKLRGAILVL